MGREVVDALRPIQEKENCTNNASKAHRPGETDGLRWWLVNFFAAFLDFELVVWESFCDGGYVAAAPGDFA